MKNDKGTLVFCESPGDPIKFYFENYDKTKNVKYKKRNKELKTIVSLRVLMKELRTDPDFYGDNDEFVSDTTLMDFINELKKIVSHFDGLKHTLASFESNLMQLIESFEDNYNNINEGEVQQARKEKENVSEPTYVLYDDCDRDYEECKESLTVCERRKRLIELAVVYVHDFMDSVIKRYIESYEEMRWDYGFVAGDDEEDDYRDDKRIKEFIKDLKTVHGTVSDALSEAGTVERKLKQHTEKLLRNHEETQNKKRRHEECEK